MALPDSTSYATDLRKSFREAEHRRQAEAREREARILQISVDNKWRQWQEQGNKAFARFNDSNATSRLLSLPPELRNRIYTMIIPTGDLFGTCSRYSRTDITALRICRTMRQELLPCFFGNNSFEMDFRSQAGCDTALKWLSSLSGEAMTALRKLYVCTLVECACKATPKPWNYQFGAAAAVVPIPSQGILKVAATIDRGCAILPIDMTADECGCCGRIPRAIMATLWDVLRSLEEKAEGEGLVLTRKGLVKLFSLIQYCSPYEVVARSRGIK